MSMIDPFVQDDEGNDRIEAAKKALTPVAREPFVYADARSDLLNGTRLDRPDDADEVIVEAVAGEGTRNASAASGTIELIHFGRVHLDAQALFGTVEAIDDLAPDGLDGVAGGRGIAHRAALQRELVFLDGTMHALMSAMQAAGNRPPSPDDDRGNAAAAIQSMLGLVGGLLGGPTSPAVPGAASTLDLAPLIAEGEALATRLDTEDIDYATLHEVGRATHELRAKYQQLLRSQVAQLPTGPDGSAPGGSLVDLPFIGDQLRNLPVVGDVLSWGAKINGVAVSLCARMAVELQLQWEPNLEAACAACTIDAIRQRRAPIYPIWYRPRALEDDVAAAEEGEERDGGGMSLDAGELLQDAIGDKVAPAVQKKNELLDLFTLDDATTPGDAFLDIAFGTDRTANLHARSATAGQRGGAAIASVLRALDEAVAPPVVADVAGYIFRIVSELIRSIYDRLLLVGPSTFRLESLLEHGRAHLVDALVEQVLQLLPSEWGNAKLNLQGKALSPWALLEPAQKAAVDRAGFLDVATGFAMRDMVEVLLSARARAGSEAMTMEAYLAVLPSLHARMFRNVFLPFWGFVEDILNGALADGLGQVLGAATGFLNKGQEVLGMAGEIRDRIKKAEKLMESTEIGTSGTNVDEWGGVFAALRGDDPSGAGAGRGPGAGGRPALFGGRTSSGNATVDDAVIDKVAPEHRWDPEAPADEPDPTLTPPAAHENATPTGVSAP
ncbi:MAG: hypothetical protein AAF715_07630 [Myxococcota bacterium]